jgi:hypothetical protein
MAEQFDLRIRQLTSGPHLIRQLIRQQISRGPAGPGAAVDMAA